MERRSNIHQLPSARAPRRAHDDSPPAAESLPPFAEHLQRHAYAKPDLLDRIADALGSERFFFGFIGWTLGLATAGLFLAVWSFGR